jgi:nucleoid DNA-binding protein
MASDVLLKGDLVARLKGHFPEILKKDLNDVADTVFDCISEALKDGRRVEIRGFGSLSIHQQKGRSFINPRNNSLTNCPANRRIVFKPSKAFYWPVDAG